jgi:hypothetical protein
MQDLATLVSAVTGLVTAIGGLIAVLHYVIPIKRAADATLTHVNRQRTDAATYTALLVDTLTEAGLVVPKDQSLSVAGAPAPPAVVAEQTGTG